MDQNQQNSSTSEDNIFTIIRSNSECMNELPFHPYKNRYVIPAAQITVLKTLGSGEFGIVQQGIWANENNRIQVAVKCLTKENLNTNLTEFIKEAAIMYSIEHENIVKLFGIVLDGTTRMLVTELAPMRSLLECLKDLNLRENFLNISTLCDYIYQICKGMVYLESKRLIHRDLAARNILVFSKTKVKISDFGLSRALMDGKTYYQTNFNMNLKLPIAWCAPECINFLRFTTSSDVWSFGVCIWEIFSYGVQPWAAMTGQQILENVDEPNYRRLEKPECCPNGYYELMLKCWQHDPYKRPTFNEILQVCMTITPLQVKVVVTPSVQWSNCGPELEDQMLKFRINDLITVLDPSSFLPLWKGVLNNGQIGLFDPQNVVNVRNSKQVNKQQKSSKRKGLLLKVLGNPTSALKFESLQYDMPKKTLDDQERLLPLTPTSPDRFDPDQTFNFPQYFHMESDNLAKSMTDDFSHEYHEIIPESGTALNSDIEAGFQELTLSNYRIKKDQKTNQYNKVKQISTKDQKILDKAIAIANKVSTKSMVSFLCGENSEMHAVTKPRLKKHHTFQEDPNAADEKKGSTSSLPLHLFQRENKFFSEELKNTQDLQTTITEEGEEAYNNLVQSTRKDSVLSCLPQASACFNEKELKTRKINQEESVQTHHIDISPQLNFLCKYKENIEKPDFHHLLKGENACEMSSNNVIPLPPKPRYKAVTSNKKHFRKYPLIVPDHQRTTLQKVYNCNNELMSLNHSSASTYQNIDEHETNTSRQENQQNMCADVGMTIRSSEPAA